MIPIKPMIVLRRVTLGLLFLAISAVTGKTLRAATSATTAPALESPAFGQWSDPVNGLQIRLAAAQAAVAPSTS